MCMFLMPQLILFFASFGENHDKGRHKAENYSKSQRQCNRTLPSTQKPAHPAEICASPQFLPVYQKIFQSLYKAAHWEELGFKLGSAMGGSCRAPWVWEPLKFFQEMQISLERCRTWSALRNRASSVAARAHGLYFYGFTLAIHQRSLPNWWAHSNPHPHKLPEHMPRGPHPYWKEEATSRTHSRERQGWSSSHWLPQILGY